MKALTGFDLIRPHTLVGALETLAAAENSMVIAGGTDVVPLFRDIGCKPEHLVDLSLLTELNGVYEDRSHIHIGATTTHSQLVASKAVRERLPALHDACSLIGSVQIRNRGTLGGNVCNASPAADSAPPLLVHGAEVGVASLRAARWEPVNGFFAGPKKTILQPEELVTGFRVPNPPAGSGSAFQRIGRRNGFCLSVVNCAAYLEREGDAVKEARLALGSVAPVPLLVRDAGESLRGKKLTEAAINEAAEVCRAKVAPIDDIRGTAEYRRDMSAVLAKRTLREAWRRAGGELQ